MDVILVSLIGVIFVGLPSYGLAGFIALVVLEHKYNPKNQRYKSLPPDTEKSFARAGRIGFVIGGVLGAVLFPVWLLG